MELKVELKDNNRRTQNGELLYTSSDSVIGTLHVMLSPPSTPVEHVGLKIELIGEIRVLFDQDKCPPFVSLTKTIASVGSLTESGTFEFEFGNADKPHDSYQGANLALRYYIRATLARNYLPDIVTETPFQVANTKTLPKANPTISMEVGIEDCLHIEFEYQKSKFHVNDVIVGRVFFLLVRIKIKHMELAIVKRESAQSASNFVVISIYIYIYIIHVVTLFV